MKPEEFYLLLKKRAKEVKKYAAYGFPERAGNTVLDFIDGNFSAQGWQGSAFKRWKKNKRGGTILVKTGNLRGGSRLIRENAQVTVRNEVPYAKIHNEGFRGVVSISSHTRNRYAKTRFLTETPTSKGNLRRKTLTGKSGEIFVKAHRRKLNMPKRQFIPTTQSPSPVLMEALKRKLTRDLKKIITL